LDLGSTPDARITYVILLHLNQVISFKPVVPLPHAIAVKRRALEALRFGLVPDAEIEQLTLGFGPLREWALARLPDSHHGRPQASEVTGPFGTGKSHTMAVIRHVARELGFATAHVEVDGTSITLSNPERLLSHLWRTLVARDLTPSSPLLDLYIRAVRNGASPPQIAPRGIDRIAANFRVVKAVMDADKMDEVGEALECIISSGDEYTANEAMRLVRHVTGISSTDSPIKRMIGRTVADRPYDFLESLVGHSAIAQLAGFRGLVVTIDEFEVEYYLLTPSMRDRVESLVVLLAQYLKGQLSHPTAPLALFFATADQPGSPGAEIVGQIVGRAPKHRFELKPWSRRDLRRLLGVVQEMYAAAYGVDALLSSETVSALLDTVTSKKSDGELIRTFVKSSVAILDSLFGPPFKDSPDAARKSDISNALNHPRNH
jgi:hypothetical protein